MKITIVEDEAMELEQLETAVKEIAENELPALSCELTCFESMQAFDAANAEPDLLILDLHLPDGNGLELAKKLKAERTNTGVIIITAYQEHVYEGYEVGAFRFLPKPVDAEKLRDAVLRYAEEYCSMKVLLVPTHTEQLVLPLDDIVCIESQGKRSVVYMQDGRNIESKKSILDYTQEIENGSFVRVHRCYLVNMKHIVRLKDSKIIFDTNACHAEISRRNRAEFDARFAAFLKTL